ncbi:Uncharacterized protein dnl_51260 [Desulfonema limicola]|uniref:Uncharacterized protein n=1 Tax=Desulfonema limicola TaxID=45656 RepID=A0A975BBU0_9BACT|nr:Uncharacterized protein dnl_51260 [Desulfonema limicola]
MILTLSFYQNEIILEVCSSKNSECACKYGIIFTNMNSR